MGVPLLFIHASTDGHFDCGHLLANAVMTWVCRCLRDPAFNRLDKYPEVGLLGHVVVQFLTLGERPCCFP